MSLRAELDKLEAADMPDLKHGVPGLQLFHRHGRDPAQAPRPTARQQQLDAIAAHPDSWAFYLGLIIAIAVVLRLLVVLVGPMGNVERAYTETTAVKLDLAHQLVEHGTFGLTQQPPSSLQARLDTLRAERGSLPLPDAHGLYPEAYRAPGYPFVLAVMAYTGLPLTVLLLAQCVLGGVAVGLTYTLAKAMARSKGAAMAAATLVALHPGLIVAAAVLDPLTIVGALVLAGLTATATLGRCGLRGMLGGGGRPGAVGPVRPDARMASADRGRVAGAERAERQVAGPRGGAAGRGGAARGRVGLSQPGGGAGRAAGGLAQRRAAVSRRRPPRRADGGERRGGHRKRAAGRVADRGPAAPLRRPLAV